MFISNITQSVLYERQITVNHTLLSSSLLATVTADAQKQGN